MNFSKTISSISTRTAIKRFASAYVMDHRNFSDEELLEALQKTAPQYFYQDNVSKTLNSLALDEIRKTRLLTSIIIKEILLNQDSFIMPCSELNKATIHFVSSIIDESNEPPKSYKGRLAQDHDFFKFVVETAWEMNSEISPDEKNLIEKIRKRLKISEREYYVLESRLNKFPKEGNKTFSLDEVNEIRLLLQSKGLLAEVRDDDGVDYDCIPEEVANSIREHYGIEMRSFGYRELISYKSKSVLNKSYLKDTINDFGYEIDTYATLNDMQDLIIESLKPTESLGGITPRGGLDVETLKNWCEDKALPVSGRKDELISRIVNFYDQLREHSASDEDTREIWFNHFEQLAHRNYEYLRSQQLIEKDIEIEKNFEAATNYLFEVLLQHKPLSLVGTKHEDGRLSVGDGILMWDNKSSESQVSLQTHIPQFNGYIKSSDQPVKGFIVIAPDFTADSANVAMNYFVENQVMISLIKATDLKDIATKFKNSNANKPFNLRYLLQPGLLNADLVVM